MAISPTVLIIGCGIAGPVLANFYKRKGYNPIVFEKVRELGDAGASLLLMPNGMKVLNLVGLADKVKEISTPIREFRESSANGDALASSCLPSTFTEKYSQPGIGIKRTTLNLLLKQMLLDLEVEVREGWELVDIEESENSVTAVFNGNRKVTGTFLIGCDGIKSATRKILLKNQNQGEGVPSFTGLTQTAGISATPASMVNSPSLRNWYGIGAHIIAYPVTPLLTSWAITLPNAKDSDESWRLYSQAERDTIKQDLALQLKDWTSEVTEMVKSAERVIKYGLFDRPELRPDQWYTKRCILVGDAAHPTSPHLGQGANQAFEDCYHLAHSMPFLIPDAPDYKENLQTIDQGLERIFKAFAEKRQPKTSLLVKGARAQGERRVVTTGPNDCRKRDEAVAASWKDVDAIAAKYDSLCREPFHV